MTKKEGLVSVPEAAKMFEVTKTTMNNWIKAGLPYTTIKVFGKGNVRMVHPEDVEKYIKDTYDVYEK